ncbi:MAG: single-stranded-DNA-specific exonuclease RecJ [Oscillospiraceae bacterium]|jgi:single-stranded-DNA-specific exonuclease|nr:single-stranded-DNA-specific exonuclease RecJ [Oscillospiraceae bacterium]
MKFANWDISGFDREAAVELCRGGINPLAAVFLSSRGILGADEAARFLADDLADIYDPFLLADRQKAVDRVNLALERGETIAIFGDYDVDGMTASALLKSFFRTRNRECEIYIPGREEEGYGLNCPAIDCLKSRGVNLIITVDCGITAVSETAYARGLGVDVIVTDHHECKDILPDAAAVVDPKRRDCPYPNKTLAGVGVAFKLVCAMEKERDLGELISEYGDLVGIGTIADVMPVTGENRVLIRTGLRALAHKPRPGLQKLMREIGVPRKEIDTAAIGFLLAPRLNAAGRMGRTSLSVDVLLTDDPAEAERLTAELSRLNAQRRELESVIFDEVAERLAGTDPKGPIVMSGQNWYQGVLGIVAARTAEKNRFPAIIISVDADGVGRGSCRSFGSFKLYTALLRCDDLLINYGGHEMAAGLTIAAEKLDEFRARITGVYHEMVKIPPTPTLHVDFEVEKPDLLVLQNVEALGTLEPFGNSFIPPCLCICGARLVSVQSVGGGKHTRMRIQKKNRTMDCIFFAMEAEKMGVVEGDRVDVAFQPQVNDFRRRTVQLHIMDIRPAI